MVFRSMLVRSGSCTSVHLASESGHVLHVEPIESHDLQAGLDDELIDSSVQVAATADNVLNGVQPVLPGCDTLVLAPAMLQKQKYSIRHEDSSDFSECLERIGNRAESPGAHGKIERSVVIGQRLGCDMLDANGKGLTGGALRDDLGKRISWIDGMELGDGLGVVRQVQSSSNPQFQHLTVDLSE